MGLKEISGYLNFLPYGQGLTLNLDGSKISYNNYNL